MPKINSQTSRSASKKLPPKRQDPKILEALLHHFSEDDVIPEWNVAKDAEDIFGSNDANLSAKYVPRLDFAVGPFNIAKEEPPFPKREEIKRRGRENETVRKIIELSDVRHANLTPNENPRCLLAVEVESSTGRKHRMGSILNASFIGCYGIVVAKKNKRESEDEIYDSLANIRSYIEAVYTVGKTELRIPNIVITKKSRLIRALE